MTDMLKQVTLAGKYKAEAMLADRAAKEMAKHCDKRISKALSALKKIRKMANTGGNARMVVDKIYWVAVEAAKEIEGGNGAVGNSQVPSERGK